MSKRLLTLDPWQFLEVFCSKSHTHVLGKAIKVKHLFVIHFPGNFRERSQLNYIFWTFLRWNHFLRLYCFTEKWNERGKKRIFTEWKRGKDSFGLQRIKSFLCKEVTVDQSSFSAAWAQGSHRGPWLRLNGEPGTGCHRNHRKGQWLQKWLTQELERLSLICPCKEKPHHPGPV